MASDLQRLLRAAKTIAWLAWKYEQKDIAAALLKHCTQREREDVSLIGQYLVDVWELYHQAEREAEPRCRECNSSVHEWKDGLARSDARCSPKCRQRAYRKRMTANRSASDRKCNDAANRDGSRVAQAN